MKILDLTKYGRKTVSFYLAVERYLLNSPEWKDEELFFIWDIHPAIVCGKHQLIEGEVNLEYAEKLGVPVYRRHSGGGTIFADEGCFMFTFIKRSLQRNEVFKSCLTDVVRAFGEIGLETEISGRNDLIFKGKKFSGNAYYRNDAGSILHGTLLYKTDIEKLVRSITPDNEKLISKGIESVRQRVINVGDYTTLSREELMRHIEHSIAPVLTTISDGEYEEICEIEKSYLTREWIWGNNPPYTFSHKKRYDFGVIEVYADIKNEVVKDVVFRGDFFTHKELTEWYKALIGIQFEKDAISRVLTANPIEEYVLGAKNEDIVDLLFEK